MGEALRFRFTLPDGSVVVGPVRGSGGMLQGGSDRAELHALQRVQAMPAALVYPDYGPNGDGPEVALSLAGATVEVVA